MMNFPTLHSQLAALHQPLDSNLKTLLAGRISDAVTLGLGHLTHILVIQPHDTEADIIEALGFSPLVSRRGIHLQPDWDWLEQHKDWYELVYAGEGDFAAIVLVQDAPGTLPDLLQLCREGALQCA